MILNVIFACLVFCSLYQILSESEADDAEILQLQERATRLLLREYGNQLLSLFYSFSNT